MTQQSKITKNVSAYMDAYMIIITEMEEREIYTCVTVTHSMTLSLTK